MIVSEKQKENIKMQIIKVLSEEQEIQKIVLFGSFIDSPASNDIDIAVFQNSNLQYLTLSLKYRKLLRKLIRTIPCDVIPIHTGAEGRFLDTIEAGEVIFER